MVGQVPELSSAHPGRVCCPQVEKLAEQGVRYVRPAAAGSEDRLNILTDRLNTTLLWLEEHFVIKACSGSILNGTYESDG